MEEKKPTALSAGDARTRFLNQHVQPHFRFEVEPDFVVFIRRPVIDDRQRLMDIASFKPKVATKKKGGRARGDLEVPDEIEVPMTTLQVAAIVLLAVDERGTPVFTQADIDSLKQCPLGGWVEKLGGACMAVMNGRDPNEPETSEGESSGGTRSEGSTTSSPTASGAPSPSSPRS